MKVPVVKLVKVKRKNKISYQLDYNLNGKRTREIVAHNKRDAEIIRADRQQKLTLGIHGIYPAQSKIISLKELIAQYLSSKSGIVRSTTYSRYKNYFDGFEKFMYKYFSPACANIKLISTRYLQECFTRLNSEPVNKKKPWHKSTVNILRDLLIEIFNQAIKEKFIDTNPASDTIPFIVPKTNTVKYYTNDQLKIIWKNLDPYWVPVFKFLYFTGLRKNEMINLTWDNISLDENNPTMTITSTAEFQTKSGRTHTIRLSNTAFEIIKKQRGKHSRYVFVNEKGNKIRKASPNEILNKALANADFKGTIHMFRHTFGANFVMNIGSHHELMQLLSHSDLESTKIYAHFSPDYMRETAEKLDKTQKDK